jgi:hypothetical protein
MTSVTFTRQVQGLEPGIKIARMIDEPIRVRRRFSGLTHPCQVGSQAAALFAITAHAHHSWTPRSGFVQLHSTGVWQSGGIRCVQTGR